MTPCAPNRPPPIAPRQFCRAQPRASVLVIVMITILFTAFALVAFIEKAGNDLLVEHREAQARRLRMEAYSALEVTLAGPTLRVHADVLVAVTVAPVDQSAVVKPSVKLPL